MKFSDVGRRSSQPLGQLLSRHLAGNRAGRVEGLVSASAEEPSIQNSRPLEPVFHLDLADTERRESKAQSSPPWSLQASKDAR